MKIGDQFPVNLDQYTVAHGVVESIEGDEVTIIIPATRVVMGIKTSLTDLERAPEVDRILAGTQQAEQTPEPPSPAPAPPAAPVVATDDIGDGMRGQVLDSSALD